MQALYSNFSRVIIHVGCHKNDDISLKLTGMMRMTVDGA